MTRQTSEKLGQGTSSKLSNPQPLHAGFFTVLQYKTEKILIFNNKFGPTFFFIKRDQHSPHPFQIKEKMFQVPVINTFKLLKNNRLTILVQLVPKDSAGLMVQEQISFPKSDGFTLAELSIFRMTYANRSSKTC